MSVNLTLLGGIFAAAIPILAQDKTLSCNERNHNGHLASSCEMRENTVPSVGQWTIDSGENGGISIKGWSRSDVLVRSRVEASAPSDAEAKLLAGQVQVDTSAGHIHPSGPAMDNNHNWSVSFEIFVPAQSNLALKTHNGGISIREVRGRMQFDAVNGGVHLDMLAGDVEGRTVNGGVHINLGGDRWDGQKLDVQTTNGGVHLNVPANYSAHLETGTVNGGLKTDSPMVLRKAGGEHQLSFDLGSGGPLIRVTTVNGGVSINHT